MVAITGGQARVGMGIGLNWNTAVQLGLGSLVSGCTVQHSENTDALNIPAIGSGLDMKATTTRGGINPTITIDGPLGYNDPRVVALAQMFGGASATSLTGGVGLYSHSIMYNGAVQSKFLTVALQAHTTGSFEYPSAVVRRATISGQARPDWMNLSLELLADQQKVSGQTNTYAVLQGITESDYRRVPFEFSDEFWINAQSGAALSSSDRLNITGFTINYERPFEHAQEAKGAAGNGQPVIAGEYPFISSIEVTTRTMADQTYFTAHQAETEYKAVLIKKGVQAGSSGWYFQYFFNFPRLKLVTPPEHNLSSAAANPQTLRFEALYATTAATGMTVSQYPYIEVRSLRSANLLV